MVVGRSLLRRRNGWYARWLRRWCLSRSVLVALPGPAAEPWIGICVWGFPSVRACPRHARGAHLGGPPGIVVAIAASQVSTYVFEVWVQRRYKSGFPGWTSSDLAYLPSSSAEDCSCADGSGSRPHKPLCAGGIQSKLRPIHGQWFPRPLVGAAVSTQDSPHRLGASDLVGLSLS